MRKEAQNREKMKQPMKMKQSIRNQNKFIKKKKRFSEGGQLLAWGWKKDVVVAWSFRACSEEWLHFCGWALGRAEVSFSGLCKLSGPSTLRAR